MLLWAYCQTVFTKSGTIPKEVCMTATFVVTLWSWKLFGSVEVRASRILWYVFANFFCESLQEKSTCSDVPVRVTSVRDSSALRGNDISKIAWTYSIGSLINVNFSSSSSNYLMILLSNSKELVEKKRILRRFKSTLTIYQSWRGHTLEVHHLSFLKSNSTNTGIIWRVSVFCRSTHLSLLLHVQSPETRSLSPL